MSIKELYQEVIIDHGKHPRNFGIMPEANHHHQGYNPLCGDKLDVYLLEQDGLILDVRFKGCGCAISIASASLMSEALKGKMIGEIEALFTGFHELVTQGSAPLHEMGKLAAFSGVSEFPTRVKCATLAWHTMKAALNTNPNPVSTE